MICSLAKQCLTAGKGMRVDGKRINGRALFDMWQLREMVKKNKTLAGY